MNRVFDRIEHVSPDGWTQYYDRTNLFQNLERHYLEVYGDHPNFKKHLISTSLRELVENTPLYGSRKIEESEMEF